MLQKHVKDSEATAMFLNIMRRHVFAFIDPKMKPLDRIDDVWYSLFMVRLWREYILSHPTYSFKDNFLTANSYSCLELGAHFLVNVILHLKRTNQPHLFVPGNFDSQPCESFFRQLRSFTSTYSTVVSCSTKEIVCRLNKIQLQSEISCKLGLLFVFPRAEKFQTANDVPNLPTEEEVITKIEECRKRAIFDASKLGLVKNSVSTKLGRCKILPKPLSSKPKQLKEITIDNKKDTANMNFRTVELKNFAHRFEKKDVIDPISSYVEISDSTKRFIVKKTSLCWLLRSNYVKLSSDRLIRVQGGPSKKCKGKRTKIGFKHFQEKKTLRKKNNFCKHIKFKQ